MAESNVRDFLDPGQAYERWWPGFYEAGAARIDDRAWGALEDVGLDPSAYTPDKVVEAAFRAGWEAMLAALIESKQIRLVIDG